MALSVMRNPLDEKGSHKEEEEEITSPNRGQSRGKKSSKEPIFASP